MNEEKLHELLKSHHQTIKQLAKHLRRALIAIHDDHEDDFRDECGKRIAYEDGGNYSYAVIGSEGLFFGDYEFDFREAENALQDAGYCLDMEVE